MQKKLFFIVLLFTCSTVTNAQFKLNISAGVGNNLNAKNDSSSFAKTNGSALSIKPTYYWGRLGLGLDLGIMKNVAGNIDEIANRLNVDTSASVNGISGGGVSTRSALIGPELCICFKKLSIIPSIRVGVIRTKIDSVNLRLGRTVQSAFDKRYQAGAQTSTDFATQSGLLIGYKLNKHLSVNLNGAYNVFKPTFQIVDFRSSAAAVPRALPVRQSYNFLRLATGITYSF